MNPLAYILKGDRNALNKKRRTHAGHGAFHGLFPIWVMRSQLRTHIRNHLNG